MTTGKHARVAGWKCTAIEILHRKGPIVSGRTQQLNYLATFGTHMDGDATVQMTGASSTAL